MSEVILTDFNFEIEVIRSNVPVLVDFYAEWCGPCKQIAPFIDELAKAYAGKIKIGKLDVDKSSETAQKYGVMGIPTLMIFRNRKVVNQLVGFAEKEKIKKKIEESLV